MTDFREIMTISMLAYQSSTGAYAHDLLNCTLALGVDSFEWDLLSFVFRTILQEQLAQPRPARSAALIAYRHVRATFVPSGSSHCCLEGTSTVASGDTLRTHRKPHLLISLSTGVIIEDLQISQHGEKSHSYRPRQDPRVRTRHPHLDLSHHGSDHSRRVPISGRLPGVQVPFLVVGGRLDTLQTGQIPTARKTVPGDARRTLPPTTGRQFRGRQRRRGGRPGA